MHSFGVHVIFDQWASIMQIKVRQSNRGIGDQSGFISSFDEPWSEWSWITDPVPVHSKGTQPEKIISENNFQEQMNER